jgi:hypothetical protein
MQLDSCFIICNTEARTYLFPTFSTIKYGIIHLKILSDKTVISVYFQKVLPKNIHIQTIIRTYSIRM